MTKFLLRPDSRSDIPASLLVQLRAIPGVRIERVWPGMVAVSFDGDLAALRDVLAGTAWSSFRASESRTYRVQSGGQHAGKTAAEQQLDGVLMQFAVERDLPAAAQLRRYVAAFPQFRQEIIEFAVSLVEDRLHGDPVEVSDGAARAAAHGVRQWHVTRRRLAQFPAIAAETSPEAREE